MDLGIFMMGFFLGFSLGIQGMLLIEMYLGGRK